MRRFARLQEAVDAWREAGAEGFVMRHQQADGGNSFLMFPTRYPQYPMNVGTLLAQDGYCLHHVFITGQPRCCHLDLERLRREGDSFAGDRAELRQVHLAVCDVVNEGRNAQFHMCNRQGGPKLSYHLNYPGLVFRDEVAERRAMHRVYELLQERGAPLLPDMAIYRREGKHGLLRCAGTQKPGEPLSALHCTVPWTNHDPTLVSENAELMERDRFPPLPDETPMELDARRFPCPRELAMAFSMGGLREHWLVGTSERTFLLLPHVREPDVLRRWHYDAMRPNNWYHLFRALRYSMLGNVLFSFQDWWEAYYDARPTGGNGDARRAKYEGRWNRVMQGPPPPLYSMSMLRRLFRALPRWCPFGGEQCELYCSLYVTAGRDVMLRCLSCQRARLVGPLDCMEHMFLFSKQYVSQAFTDDEQLPRTLCINAPMGTGKTTFLKELLRNHPQWSCIGITCRRTLASFLVEQLQLRSYDALRRAGREAYVDFFRNATERHPARLAIQLESLRTLRSQFRRAQPPVAMPQVDVLILDEYQSLMQQFMSETMAHRHREAFEVLQWFVRQAKRVVVLDADLMCQGAPWEQLQLWRSAESLHLHLNLRLPSPRKRFVLTGYETAMERLRADVRAGEIQVALVATSKLELKAVERMLSETELLASSGSYTSESQPEDMEEVTRCNEHWPTLQMVAFSPTITVGVSYEGAARRVYLLLGDSSCTPETALQMVGRFRESTEVVVVLLPRTRRWHRALPLTAEAVLAAGDALMREYVDEVQELDMDTGMFTVQPEDPLTRLLAYGRAQQNCNQMMEQRFRRLIFLHGDELVDERPVEVRECVHDDERPDEVPEKHPEPRRTEWEELLERCADPGCKEKEQVSLVMGEGVTRGMAPRDLAYVHDALMPLVLWRLVHEDVPEWQLESRAELCARGLLYDQRAMELPAYHLLDALGLSKEPLVVARHWVALARLLRASLRPLEEVRGRDFVLLSELRTAVMEEEYQRQVLDRWRSAPMAAQAQQLGLGTYVLDHAGDARWTGRYFECLFRAVGMALQTERPRTARQREEPRFYMDTERYAYHNALWQGQAADAYEGSDTPLPLSRAHLYG